MKSLFLVTTFLSALSCMAQQSKSPDNSRIDFNRFDVKKITLPTVDSVVMSSTTYGDLIVEDYRFDTTTLGFMQRNTLDRTRFIRFTKSTSATVRDYMISSIKNLVSFDKEKPEIVLIIKKLWLSDDLPTEEPEDQKLRKDYAKISGISICLEYFTKLDDQYIPFLRFDTTISGKKTVSVNAENYISEALLESFKKLNHLPAKNFESSSKKYSSAYIKNMYLKRFELPILSATFQKGIYLSFEEFKTNAPSIKDFTIISDSKTDNLYMKDNSGKEVLLRSLYGYSDGKDVYIWTSDNFYKLHKTGNTFNLYAARSFLVRTPKSRIVVPGNAIALGNPFFGPVISPALIVRSSDQIAKSKINAPFTRTLHPYQLDMETGDFY